MRVAGMITNHPLGGDSLPRDAGAQMDAQPRLSIGAA
jgi:hypothetical protein